MKPEQLESDRTLIEQITVRGGKARALGGVGVALRCPGAVADGPFARPRGDLDLVATRDSLPVLCEVVAEHGFVADRRFNALHGRSRLLFVDGEARHLDVFVNHFSMCHALELEHRLDEHPLTLDLADLLLTKLQVAELNAKDVFDVLALLSEHDLTEDETGINSSYLIGILSGDWGWWRTATASLATVVAYNNDQRRIPPALLDRAHSRAATLSDVLAGCRKSLRWRARARIGERIPWREDPEELAVG